MSVRPSTADMDQGNRYVSLVPTATKSRIHQVEKEPPNGERPSRGRA